LEKNCKTQDWIFSILDLAGAFLQNFHNSSPSSGLEADGGPGGQTVAGSGELGLRQGAQGVEEMRGTTWGCSPAADEDGGGRNLRSGGRRCWRMGAILRRRRSGRTGTRTDGTVPTRRPKAPGGRGFARRCPGATNRAATGGARATGGDSVLWPPAAQQGQAAAQGEVAGGAA
jgi:hypothetical protein